MIFKKCSVLLGKCISNVEINFQDFLSIIKYLINNKLSKI